MDDDTKTTDANAPQPAPAIPLSKVITPEKKAFLAALAKAQGEFLMIEKNQHAEIRPRDATKTPYSFDYADLGEILAKTKAARAANGLSVRHIITGHDGDTAWLNSIVGHAEGWEDVSSLQINTVADDIKTFGGRVRFLRRYLLEGQLGVSAGDDVDVDGTEAGEGRAMGDVARGDVKLANAPKPTPARKSAGAQSNGPAQRQAAQSGPPEDPPPPDGFTTPAKPSEAAQAPPGPTNAEIEAASIEAQFRAHGSKLVDPEPPATPPPPTPAPPAQSAAKPSGNSAPCTPGEILYIAKRIRSCGIAIRPTLDEMGATDIPDDLTGLTKAQWTALLKVTSPS